MPVLNGFLPSQYSQSRTLRSFPSTHSEDDRSKVAVNPGRVVRPPNVEYFKFDVTCVVCWKDSGFTPYYCSEGHATCQNCYRLHGHSTTPGYLELENLLPVPKSEKDVGLGICHAKLKSEEECGLAIKELEEVAIMTPYFGRFVIRASFKCGAAVYGCKYVDYGFGIDKHETMHCEFRALRNCGFRYVNKCHQTFHDMESHAQHLVIDHQVPYFWNGEGSFLLKYDRAKFTEKDGVSPYNITPLVRGVIKGGKEKIQDFYCFLMGKDRMIKGKKDTQIWFCLGTTLENQNYELVADCCIFPPSHKMIDEVMKTPRPIRALRKSVTVFPDMMSSLSDKSEEGMVLDLKNEELDNHFKIEMNGEKYFSLAVEINFVEKGSDPDEKVIVISPDEIEKSTLLQLELQEIEKEIEELENQPYKLFMTPEEAQEEKRRFKRIAELEVKHTELGLELDEYYRTMDDDNDDIDEALESPPLSPPTVTTGYWF